MPNRPLPRSWALAPLAAGAVLLANVVLAADSSYYDEDATVGGLQKVCKSLSIDSSGVLKGSCNKSTAGIVSLATASLDINRLLSCDSEPQVQLEIRSDGVFLSYTCPTKAEPSTDEDDLNDYVSWDATTGKLSWKSS